MQPRTLFAKLWDEHVVVHGNGGPDLLYIDVHLLHEMTSPQAFEGLAQAGREVRRPDLTVATEDHNVPTHTTEVTDPLGRQQLTLVRANTARHGVPHHPMGSATQGIVHVMGPELGLSHPGATVVCGDSHTSTHGAFGALAFGIGTSQVEHVLATQTLWMKRPEAMRVRVTGQLPDGVSAKDLALAVVRAVGPSGGAGAVIEYCGDTIERLSMAARMTLCNMTIECGARAGMIAPDATTLAHLAGRPHAPSGTDWTAAVDYWSTLHTDPGATFDRTLDLDASTLTPTVTWGTVPSQSAGIGDTVPDPADCATEAEADTARRALAYMDLQPGTPLREIAVDTVFIGSCTNGRLEDLRAAADVLRGRTVAPGVTMLVVPGSAAVAREAQQEGLDQVFTAAGAQWRTAGCSMCTAMNPDLLAAGQRSASTTNRNFEGRQGPGARTHLVSPATAAATAVAGHLASPADLH